MKTTQTATTSAPMSSQTRAAFIGHVLGARSEGRVDFVLDALVGAKEHDEANPSEQPLMAELRGYRAAVA